MKKIICAFIILQIAAMLFSQEEIKERSFYFGIGGGIAFVEPHGVFGIEQINDQMTRVTDLSIGFAVNDKLYLLGSISRYGASSDYGTTYQQYSNYINVYGIGIRYYPVKTGLVLGVDIVPLSIIDAVRDFSLGYHFLVAFDFDRTKTGISFLLGFKDGRYDIQGIPVETVCLFANFIWKLGLKQ